VGAQGYANTSVTQTGEDDLAEQALGALVNLATATATAADQGVVAQLTEAKSRLSKELEDNVTALKEVNALLKKERAERANSGNSERPPRRTFKPSSDNYLWSQGY
jgi:hypothetical protein